MTGKELKIHFISALLVVPTGSLEGWKELSFNKIPKNTVSIIDSKSIQVEVNQSASPLIYKLPDTKKVSLISLQINVQGDLSKLSTNAFPEDSIIRLGLVAKGEKTLSWLQRKIAANWVLELFSLAPPNVGLDKIYFYNFSTSKELIGQKRQHPKSELMLEEIIASFPETKAIEHKLAKPIDVVALWISIDGDDTKSKYTTTIESIKLETAD
jgi:hypothetical protein